MIELLAPAKDKICARAAIDCGADAVYIGAPSFGARKSVPNSLEDIKEIVDYAHKYYVRVHVTINTILTDSELMEAKKMIWDLYNIGVDAIIVQDMGILKLALDGVLPPIQLHASTQCDNRTLKKVKFFEDIGVSRVILARELSLEQIKKICAETNIDIEMFIHGALCVCYSGQCYLSCAKGGRSANRGECAQACRKKYTLIDENGKIIAKDKYLLSMKDFNASHSLRDLINAGIKSLKIEGRLKGENYVKNVTAFYRREIDKYAEKTSSGKVFLDFEPDLHKSFNRGFTDYFLNGRKHCHNFDSVNSLGEKLGKVKAAGKDFFEIDAQINPQDGLCYFEDGEIHGFLVNKAKEGKIYPNKMPKISIGTVVYRNNNVKFEKQLANSKTKRRIKADFTVEDGMIKVRDEDGNFVSIVYTGEKPDNPDKMKETLISQLKKYGQSDFYVENIEIKTEYVPFMPISKINELRRTIFEKLMAERLKNYPRTLVKPIKYAEYPVKILDYRANIHNNSAREFYKNCGCEITEMSFESSPIRNCELMRTKHCIKYALNMCKSQTKLWLTDDKGKKYPLKFDCKNCEMVLLS